LVVDPNLVVSQVIKDLQDNDAVDKAVTEGAGVLVSDSGLVGPESAEAKKVVDHIVGSKSVKVLSIPYVEKLPVIRKPQATATVEASGSCLQREKEVVDNSKKQKKKLIRKRNPAPETIVDGEQQSDKVEVELVEKEQLVADQGDVKNQAEKDVVVVLPKKGRGRPCKTKEVVGDDLKKPKAKAAAVEGERMVNDDAEVENESEKDGDDVVLSKLVSKKGRGRAPKVVDDAGVVLKEKKKKAVAVQVPTR